MPCLVLYTSWLSFVLLGDAYASAKNRRRIVRSIIILISSVERCAGTFSVEFPAGLYLPATPSRYTRWFCCYSRTRWLRHVPETAAMRRRTLRYMASWVVQKFRPRHRRIAIWGRWRALAYGVLRNARLLGKAGPGRLDIWRQTREFWVDLMAVVERLVVWCYISSDRWKLSLDPLQPSVPWFPVFLCCGHTHFKRQLFCFIWVGAFYCPRFLFLKL